MLLASVCHGAENALLCNEGYLGVTRCMALCCLVWNWCACLARWLLLKLQPACCRESQMQLRVHHLWWRNRLNNVLNISTVHMTRDAIVTMLTGTRPREFYIRNVFLPVLYQYWIIFCLFCMGVKLGRWHCGRKGSWVCLRTWCWGEYLDLGGAR